MIYLYSLIKLITQTLTNISKKVTHTNIQFRDFSSNTKSTELYMFQVTHLILRFY